MSRVGQGPLPGYESPSINRPNSFTVSGPVTTDGVAVFTIQAGQNVTLEDGKFSYDKVLLDDGNLQKFSASGDNGSAVSGQRILNWGTTNGASEAGRAISQLSVYTSQWVNITQNDITRQDNPVMFKTNEGEMVASGVREGLVKMYAAQSRGKGFLTGDGDFTNDWTTLSGNIFQMGYGLGDGAGNAGNVVYADFSQITKYPLDFLDPDQRWFAFSTRRLSYQAENCMEVYRNNDPTDTQVIGWDDNGYIDVTALGLFSAGADVRVKTWYNQSGNGYHATVPDLALNPTRGPLIYPASGSVRTIGGNSKICLDFATAQWLKADTGGTGDVDQPLWAAVVGATDQTSSGRHWFDGDDADRTMFYQSFDGGTPNLQRWAWGAGIYPETNLPGSKTDTDGHIFAMQFNGATSSFKKDAQVIGYNLNVSTGDNDGLTIGNRYTPITNSEFDGIIAEIVMFSGSGAMGFDDNFISKYLTNANTYYDIWAEFSTGLLDTYSGAAAAYSMRRLSSTYTGACLKVERSTDGTTKDIGFDEAGNLDVLTLLEFVDTGDGRIHTWFDQSGNSINAVQTTDAAQPKICVSQTNLLLQSNQFGTSPWFNSQTTNTSGQTGYDGTSDAWLATVNTGAQIIGQNISKSGVHTVSLYAKGSVNNGLRIFAFGDDNVDFWYNLNTGAVDGGVSPKVLAYSIEDAGSGWWRCSFTFSQNLTAIYFYMTDNNRSNASSGSIYIQDAQLEPGEVATGYTETTTTALSGTSLVQENEKPAMEFDGTDSFMTSSDYIVELSQNPASVFLVSQTTTLSNANYILAEGDSVSPYSSNFILGGGGVPGGTDILWVNTTTFGTMQTGQTLIGFDYNQTNFQAYIDGASSGGAGTATVLTETSLYTYIGRNATTGAGTFFTGKIQELITYKSDQSANRTGIETNINDYFNVY